VIGYVMWGGNIEGQRSMDLPMFGWPTYVGYINGEAAVIRFATLSPPLSYPRAGMSPSTDVSFDCMSCRIPGGYPETFVVREGDSESIVEDGGGEVDG
jgi:hypothetical protein